MLKLSKYLPILALLFSIVGARLQNSTIPVFTIVLIAAYVVLVAFNKADEKWYGTGLFCIGAALLLQTSLMTNGLVGSDIHTEYYFYKLAYANGWDPSIAHAYNSSIGTTVVAPFLARLLGINGVWIFKLVYPLLFSLVPVILYSIYKEVLSEQKAMLAAFFLIAVPTWSMELVGLPRQQLSELMLAVMLVTICIVRWSWRIKAPIILISSILGIMFHYATAPVIAVYLVGGSLIHLLLGGRSKIVLGLSLLVVVVGVVYYLDVSQGEVGRAYYTGVRTIAGKLHIYLPNLQSPSKVQSPEAIRALSSTSREPLVQTALGLDFFKVSLLGKVFRVFQLLTQLSLVVGTVAALLKWKRYRKEYLAYTAVSVIFIALTVAIPQFAGSINATRMYHLTLLMAAPLFIVGGLVVFRSTKALILLLIIPYFLLTSGLIFESTRQSNISSGELPYSYALSSNRLEVVAKFTDNDYSVMEWGTKNLVGKWAFDINGMLLFSESLDPLKWMEEFFYIPRDATTLPEDTYVFLAERNVETRELTFKPHWWAITGSTTGMREQFSFDFINWNSWVEDKHIIYQKGNAQIWGK